MTTDQTHDEQTDAAARAEASAPDSTDPAPSDRVAAEQPSPAFPLVGGRQKGYDRAAVDAFMARARAAFEDDANPAVAAQPSPDDPTTADVADSAGTEETAPVEPPFSAATVRAAAFPLARRGYLIAAVDGALGRIEDAFAARERERRLAAAGTALWVADARRTAQEILDRLSRPAKHKFGRTGVLRFGYRVDEVDLVAGKLIRYFEEGEAISVEQVRQAAFRMQRSGYREEQVDALLDAVVEVMLAVR